METNNHLTPLNNIKDKHIKENNNKSNAELLTEIQEAFRKMGEENNFNRVGGKVIFYNKIFIFYNKI